MNKIYCIEQGSYSDYRIVGIYDSEEKAQIVADYLNKSEDAYDDCTVVERQLNPSFEEINEGLSIYHVLMLKDGTTEKIEKSNVSSWEIEQNEVDHRIWRRSTTKAFQSQNLPDCLDIKMFAKDEQHAIKIANERRIFLLARNQW